MIAVGNVTNVVFCDTVSGGRLLNRPGWRITACAFDPQGDSLFAAFSSGLFRWQWSLDDQGRIDLRGMEQVFKGRGWRAFTFSADGRHFVAANIHSNAAFVFDRTFTNCLATVGPHRAADAVAISPDGQWIATGSTTDRQVRVWRAGTGESALVIPVGSDPRAAFSGDGHWLATFGDAFTLHAVGSWQPAQSLPWPERRPILGAAAFSRDGRILAVVCDLYTVQLIDLANFPPTRIAAITRLGGASRGSILTDGAQLAGVGALGRVQLWDLHRIRARLQEFSLDWDVARRVRGQAVTFEEIRPPMSR